MRVYSQLNFDKAFHEVEQFEWQEWKGYYKRYKSRYRAIVKQYCSIAAPEPQRVLEIGGGQIAYTLRQLWSDEVTVADVVDVCFDFLKKNDIDSHIWNLARDNSPIEKEFDCIICSEVIEHLPIPGHIALERLREKLRPGGCLILTTPNLYRLRNIAFLALGRRIFDVFQYKSDGGGGHIIEYSKEHLLWQFEKTGFKQIDIKIVDFSHVPNRMFDKCLAFLGKPIAIAIPRLRDNLMAVAYR